MKPLIVTISVLALAACVSSQALPPVPMAAIDGLTEVDSATADVESICAGLPAAGSPELIPMTKSPTMSACAEKPGQDKVCLCLNFPDFIIGMLKQAIEGFVENKSSTGWMVACGACAGGMWNADLN